jgi:hypothetical protein
MLVVNLWGAPSSGKSTTAAGLFFLLKINKWRVELVTEFAKEMVWERNASIFGQQAFIFAEQNRRLRRLEDHDVEVAITDSPLPLPAFYQREFRKDQQLEQLAPLVFEQFHRYNNVNYLLTREGSFEAIGRRHDEAQALGLAKDLREFMEQHAIEFMDFPASPMTPKLLFEDLQSRRQPTVNDLPFMNTIDPDGSSLT